MTWVNLEQAARELDLTPEVIKALCNSRLAWMQGADFGRDYVVSRHSIECLRAYLSRGLGLPSPATETIQ